MTTPDPDRDCEHGQLARACNQCADAREIAALRFALDRKSAALQLIWRERDELRAQVGRIVDTVREVYAANADASDGHTFRLLTPRQVQAWTALGAACGGLDVHVNRSEPVSGIAWLQQSDAEMERRTGEPHIDGWPLYSGLPPAA